MSRLAARVCRIYYHLPSLVQHVGRQSVWGGHYHYTPDFDPEWRQDDAMQEIYTPEFFSSLEHGSLASARTVVPMLLEFLRPNTVVDVGCATGAWLAAFREAGVEDVWGVDGGRVDPAALLFPAERFLVRDLRRPWTAGVRADLVVSLEMAEHLPPECADDFIESLVRCGPVVLFSAAVPGQGGYGHYNEQWPEYWAARFERHGYLPIDCLRHRIWNNPTVPFWYRQNILLFADRARVETDAALQARYEASRGFPLSIVHPDLYRMRALPGGS
jgi:SAM-dependent methyltransferase